MNKIVFLSLALCFLCGSLLSQKNVNSYKYVLVPNQFNFQKSADSYQVNSLTKFLFDKAGFTTFISNESIPEELARNRCHALHVVLNKQSSLLTTKVNIDLLDCNNSIVFSTKDGSSREKDYKKAYHEAIRDAFEDIQELNYKYDGDLTLQSRANLIAEEKVSSVKIKIDQSAVEKEPVVEKKVQVSEKKPIEIEKKSTPEKKVKTKKKKPVETEKKLVAKKDKKVEKVEKEKKEKKAKKAKSSGSKITLTVTLEGTFDMGKWGECRISRSGEKYDLIGGDENFVFAMIYKTSKPNLYIIKWAAYKEPQLLELSKEGNLIVDTKDGTEVHKRLD